MMNKKIILISLTMLIAASFAACRKKNAETSGSRFERTSQKITFKISPLSLAGSAQHLISIKHSMNLDSLVMSVNSAYNRKNLKSISLRSCILYMENEIPSLGTFSQLKLEALSVSNVLVGSLENIKDTSLFTLTIPGNTQENLVPAFVTDTITYLLSGTPRRTTSDTMNCTAEFIYSISVDEQ